MPSVQPPPTFDRATLIDVYQRTWEEFQSEAGAAGRRFRDVLADRVLELLRTDARMAHIEAVHTKVERLGPWCAEDGYEWPCRTIRALRGDA